MQSKPRREIVLLSLTLVWVLFILGGYYYFHKPINVAMIAPPLSALIDLLFLALFAGLAGGLGRRLVAAENIPPLERAALQFALGAGIIALAWLGLGALGWYRFPLGAPVLLLGWIVLWRDARAWYRALGAIKDMWQQTRGLEKGLAVLGAVLVVFQLFIALAPPIKWDALAYHLQLPRQYLAAGRLVFIPENPYWGHPQIVEMLNTFALSFHRVQTAAVLGWGVGVIFLLGLLGFTHTQLTRLNPETYPASAPAVGGWMASLAVLAGVTFRYLLGWSYTDLYSALFGLAALIAFFTWLDEARPAWFLWACLFCGFALGTKWTEGLLPAGLFIAALLSGRHRRLPLKTWAAGALIILAAVLPWMVKNLLETGSPLYPYIFGTLWVDSARMASANLPPSAIDWWQHLLAPLATTWAGVDSAPGFATDLGPLLLLFAVPGLWVYRRSPQAKTCLILLGLGAFSLAVLSLRFEHLIQTRLYFALLPALALPAGWGWDWLQRQVWQGVRMRRIFSAVILLVFGFIFWQDSYWMADTTPLRYFMGAQTQQSYLENTVGYYIRAMDALKALPTSARTLMLWEPRGLYAPLNAQADLWIDRWRTDRRALQTAQAVLDHWKQQGFTHVLVYQQGVELIRPQPGQAPSADWVELQKLFALMPPPTSIGGQYNLYKIQ